MNRLKFLVALGFGICLMAPGLFAQDEALEKLLRDVEKKNAPADKPAAGKKAAEVGKADAGLDDLLKKLGGGSNDKPLPKGDQPPAGPDAKSGPGDMPKGEKPGTDQPKSTLPKPAGGLAGLKSKSDGELDMRLEEILGRKRKKPNQNQSPDKAGGEGQQGESQEEEPSNPEMKKLVEKMREVEKRLSEPDTGEDTRKKQQEIVQNIDQIIERMRQMSQQQQQQRRQRQQQQQQQGQEQAQNDQNNPDPGAMARGVGEQALQKPSGKSRLDGKDVWGHLPPELRDVMRNVFREESLPAREELVRRYYMSVSKKSLARSSTP
ncbi:MAG: hypothetical protein ACKO85_07415 [Isosphaeraceae bacterium]